MTLWFKGHDDNVLRPHVEIIRSSGVTPHLEGHVLEGYILAAVLMVNATHFFCGGQTNLSTLLS